MRKKFCQYLALLLALTGWSFSNAFAANKPAGKYTLAVLPLEASGRIAADEANVLTERLVAELERTGMFVVTPQNTVAMALSNSGAGCSTVPCGVEAGKQLAVKLIVNGTVRKVGQLYFVETQMIHTGSGQVVERANEDFDGDFEGLQSLMATVARKLVGKSSLLNGGASPASARELTAGSTGTAEQSGGTGNTTEYRSGGNKVLVYSLVAVGAVGAAVGISQLTKSSDNKTKPPTTGNNLPNPPSFP
jgi:TolB-like protein